VLGFTASDAGEEVTVNGVFNASTAGFEVTLPTTLLTVTLYVPASATWAEVML
jgi:hypothetical protein